MEVVLVDVAPQPSLQDMPVPVPGRSVDQVGPRLPQNPALLAHQLPPLRLFHRVYPQTQQGSQEAEDIGRAVLASQFASGLLPDVKRKVAGSDGDMQQLLVKVRFEEA